MDLKTQISATLSWHLIFCVEKLSDALSVPPWRSRDPWGQGKAPLDCSAYEVLGE